jgi:hypothetical protein
MTKSITIPKKASIKRKDTAVLNDGDMTKFNKVMKEEIPRIKVKCVQKLVDWIDAKIRYGEELQLKMKITSSNHYHLETELNIFKTVKNRLQELVLEDWEASKELKELNPSIDGTNFVSSNNVKRCDRCNILISRHVRSGLCSKCRSHELYMKRKDKVKGAETEVKKLTPNRLGIGVKPEKTRGIAGTSSETSKTIDDLKEEIIKQVNVTKPDGNGNYIPINTRNEAIRLAVTLTDMENKQFLAEKIAEIKHDHYYNSGFANCSYCVAVRRMEKKLLGDGK